MTNAVEYLSNVAKSREINLFHGAQHFIEDANGELNIAGKKFSVRTDEAFINTVPNGGVILSLNALQTLEIISSGKMNNSIGMNMFKRSFLIENFIRFKENLRADCAETLFIIECMTKNPSLMLMAFPFYLDYAKPTGALSSTWQDDFKTYTDAVDNILSSITDKALKDRFKFQFLKNYWA